MIVYTVERSGELTRYLADGLVLENLDRVPPAVIARLEESDSYRYDDQPDLPRCLWCDAPGVRSRQVYVDFIPNKDAQYEKIQECEEHYQAKSLGKIVAEMKRQDTEKPKPQLKMRKKRRTTKKRKHPEMSVPVPTQPQPTT